MFCYETGGSVMSFTTSAIAARLLAATAVCFTLIATPAFAADDPKSVVTAEKTPEDAPDQLTDIVVTAEKRPQSAQKTPISISVLSGDDLANRHVVSLADLGDGSIPSLKVAPFYSRNSALIVNIRGVGVLSDSNQPARDQGVGVYIDGVYLGRAQGLGTALFDIENIEVLKGPQGTLFGRNTEGGAVNIVTKRPSGEYHLNTIAGIGNYGAYKGEVHLDLPAIQDIAVKIDAVVSHRGPLVRNPLTGADGFNAYDKRGLHYELLWKPTSDFSADYSFDTSYDASTPLYLQLLAPGTYRQAPLGTVQPQRARDANVGVPQQPSVGKVRGNQLTLAYHPASALTVKSITAYRAMTQTQYDNGSAASTLSAPTTTFVSKDFAGNTIPLPFSRYSLADFRQNQFSQEVQLIGDVAEVQFVAGALYYQEHVEDNARAFYTNQCTTSACTAYTILPPNFRTDVANYAALPLDYTAQRIDRASYVKTSSVGAFGQATWTPAALDDRLHLTGGLRWSRDAKQGTLLTVNGKLPVDRRGVSRELPLDARWSRVDPMVNLAVDATRDVHLYGKWSTGYKSGGANSRSQEYDAFDPETVSVFEIGAKTEFFDRHARFNIAAYAGTYKDIQIDFQRPYVDGKNGATTRTTISTLNAPGTGGIHGVEAELTVMPVRGVTLHGSYAHTYVHIPPAVNPYPNAKGDLSTLAVPIYQTYTPSDSASAAADFEVPLTGATLRAHIDGNYDSGFYASSNDPVYVGANNPGNVYQPKGDAAFIVNTSLALADIAMGEGDAKVTLSVWARNLFDEQHVFYKTLSVTTGLQGFYNEPRTLGGQVQVTF